MSDRKRKQIAEKHERTIPLQVRVGEDTREKLKAIAEANSLSLNDIATMCLAAGIGRVSTKLAEIASPEPEKQAA